MNQNYCLSERERVMVFYVVLSSVKRASQPMRGSAETSHYVEK